MRGGWIAPAAEEGLAPPTGVANLACLAANKARRTGDVGPSPRALPILRLERFDEGASSASRLSLDGESCAFLDCPKCTRLPH